MCADSDDGLVGTATKPKQAQVGYRISPARWGWMARSNSWLDCPDARAGGERKIRRYMSGAYPRGSPLGRWSEKSRITRISRIIVMAESATGTKGSFHS